MRHLVRAFVVRTSPPTVEMRSGTADGARTNGWSRGARVGRMPWSLAVSDRTPLPPARHWLGEEPQPREVATSER